MATHPIAWDSAPLDPKLIERFERLRADFRSQRPDEDDDLLEKAFWFAAARHGDQVRKSGEPYLIHPLEVAGLLVEMRLDKVSVASGLLHDTVEDTSTTVEEMKSTFGPEVARVVDGVTKLGRIRYSSTEDRQAENYRKMLLAMTQDIRVILVKLADRLHNMRTLEHLPAEKQVRIARETREIYAPIALRLGMGKMRSELEDLAFQHIEAEEYAKVAAYLESKKEANKDFLEEIQRTLEERLRENEIPARVDGRIKRPYSIYRKLQRQRISLEQVYDLLALRVITDSKKNCYAVLGVIHNEWRPVPDRIKDMIAMPRPNLYQSLHTSVITQEGQRFEVQIRTEEMHRMAEEGICAHWKYKEGRAGPADDDERVAWLRRLLEWQQDLQDPGDFLSTLKIDLYPEEVYVFTPRGKLTVLPRGATPVDFAYAIHTEVGHTCVGAKVDGRIVPLRYSLQNGDQCEIITQKGREPSPDWLGFVKTSRARHKIKQSLNARRRQRAEEIGGRLLEREMRRLKATHSLLESDEMRQVAQDHGCSQLSDLQAAVGYGRFSPRKILERAMRLGAERHGQTLAEEPPKPAPLHVDPDTPIAVRGSDDILVYRARCCNPISGEPIVGYVTRGKGVAVHSRDCPNVQNLMYEAERRIEVDWAPAKDVTFPARLSIYVDDRPNILNDITTILKEENVNIHKVDSRDAQGRDRPTVINLTVALTDVGQLERISKKMRALPYVREVSRNSKL